MEMMVTNRRGKGNDSRMFALGNERDWKMHGRGVLQNV